MKICHVCKKEKKPYLKIMDSNVLSMMEHYQAREDGDICERCDDFFAMTGEFKDATEEEFELAGKGVKFASNMLKWWTKDKPLDMELIEDDSRKWAGTNALAKWYREEFAKNVKGEQDGK